MKTIRAIDLFSGCGGLALGFQQAGIESVAYVEKDKYACETLRTNFDKDKVWEHDISKMDFSKWLGKVDVVVGGPPCQSFSYAGKGLGMGDVRGTLFYQFARAVEEVKPKVFVMENVRGLMSHDKGRTVVTMSKVFWNMGYTTPVKLMRAVDYGVPQKRERMFMIGIRGDYDVSAWEFPEESYAPHVTLREALKDCPPSEHPEYPEKRRKILELVPEGGNWRDLPPDLQVAYKNNSSGGGQTGFARRLSWDEPSLTIMTSPIQKKTERCHPTETRPLTVRECARIQTFPDWFEFKGSMSAKYRQIGNAVPVLLAKKIGESVVDFLS